MLREELSKINPSCVIIDTLREAHSGDENDATAMQSVIARLEATVKPAALILVAHSRKGNTESGPSTINDNRGSNYVVGKMDAIVHMRGAGEGHAIMTAVGRAMEETSIHLNRQTGGTWELAERDRVKVIARELLKIPTGSLREKARKLAEMTGKDEAACLSILHRLAD